MDARLITSSGGDPWRHVTRYIVDDCDLTHRRGFDREQREGVRAKKERLNNLVMKDLDAQGTFALDHGLLDQGNILIDDDFNITG